MISIADIIKIFIKYAIDAVRHKLPLLDKNRFPKSLQINATSLNEWGRSPVLDVPFLFNTCPCSDLTFIDKLKVYLELENKTRFHFHGTSWDSSHDIISDGIRCILLSNDVTDFGLKCFYVGDIFEIAYEWARRKSAGYAAVLCYSFDNLESFDGSTIKKFSDAGNDWRNTVYKFRRTVGNSYLIDMKKYDLINGPICRVGNDFISCEEDISPKLYKGNIAFQTAVRNDKTSLQMDSKLRGVVFFPLAEKMKVVN